ncbi:MAG TPA: hypothetical protein VD866_24950 [Urbifossiella sp.]|nr:hypothetical protein [Urbifossiella sp.]
MPAAPVANWSLVEPDRTYTSHDVAALLNCSLETANRRLKAGLIASLPRLTRTAPFRVLGSELLRLLGEQGLCLAGPSESAAERKARGAAALDRVRRAAGRK